jgi:hypothetical protein
MGERSSLKSKSIFKFRVASMEKYLFSVKEEFIASDQIAGPTYVLNLTAQIIVMGVCFFLFRIL